MIYLVSGNLVNFQVECIWVMGSLPSYYSEIARGRSISAALRPYAKIHFPVKLRIIRVDCFG